MNVVLLLVHFIPPCSAVQLMTPTAGGRTLDRGPPLTPPSNHIATVGGHTLDYGPFGFVQEFKPYWNPFTSDLEGKFGFLRQPRAMQVNLITLARSLMPLVAASSSDQKELEFHAAEMQVCNVRT